MKHIFLVTLELVVEADEYSQWAAALYVDGVLSNGLQAKDKAENVTAYKLETKE